MKKKKLYLKKYKYYPPDIIQEILDNGNILITSFSGDLKDSLTNNGRLVLKEWWPDYKTSNVATCLYIYNPITNMVGIANEPDCFIYQYINTKFKESIRINNYTAESERNNDFEDIEINI